MEHNVLFLKGLNRVHDVAALVTYNVIDSLS